jgi:hypothetical protein
MSRVGVARSIESDVDNLMRLISIANILPKGLYVENAVKVGELTCSLHQTLLLLQESFSCNAFASCLLMPCLECAEAGVDGGGGGW